MLFLPREGSVDFKKCLLTSKGLFGPKNASKGLQRSQSVRNHLSLLELHLFEPVSTSENLFFNFLSHFCQLLSETFEVSGCGKSFSWTAFISKPHFNESNAKMIPFFIYFILYSIIIYFIALIYFSRVNFKLNINKSTKKEFFFSFEWINGWWWAFFCMMCVIMD